MSKYDILDKVMGSAPLQETELNKGVVKEEQIRFTISLPKNIIERIEKVYGGPRNSYILIAVMERLKKDES